MAIFVGTHENKVDRKGRVSVPAKYRDQLAGQEFHGVYIFPHHKYPALIGCGWDQMQQFIEDLEQYDEFSEEYEERAQILFADAEQLAFDGEGRIMLTPDLMAHAGIADRAAFVAQGKTFHIWNPETYAEHRAATRKRAVEKGVTISARRRRDKEAAA